MSEAEFQSDSGGNRRASVTKRGGYQGSFDPGEPTRLMQPQTVPVRSRFAWSPRQAFWKRLGLMFNRWAEACYRKGRR